ncbi:hypothetical protein MTO96_007622 [Rhipicephalus appendiculatus]
MDASTTPTDDTTTTRCVQPTISSDDTQVNTDALDLDELTSASEDEAAAHHPKSSASLGPASDTAANWKLAISHRQRQRQKKFDQARAEIMQPAGPASTPPSHVAAGAAPAENAPAAPADAACLAPARTPPHVMEPAPAATEAAATSTYEHKDHHAPEKGSGH